MKRHLAFLPLLFLCPVSQATIIGSDGFGYAAGNLTNSLYNDGVYDGLAGGAGWARQVTDEGVPNNPSDWDQVFGSNATVGGGLVSLSNQGILRQFSGGDGAGGANDEGSASPSSEREGAQRDVGTLYFYTVFTYRDVVGPANDWAGMSSYDFGTERMFFGVGSGPNRFTINESGVGVTDLVSATSNSYTPGQQLAAVFGETYAVLGELDFPGNQLRMWVNPNAGDSLGTADFVRPYTGTNWSTGVRLAAGDGVTADYGLVVVGDDFQEIIDTFVVPEPASVLLLVAGGLLLGLRRRR